MCINNLFSSIKPKQKNPLGSISSRYILTCCVAICLLFSLSAKSQSQSWAGTWRSFSGPMVITVVNDSIYGVYAALAGSRYNSGYVVGKIVKKGKRVEGYYSEEKRGKEAFYWDMEMRKNEVWLVGKYKNGTSSWSDNWVGRKENDEVNEDNVRIFLASNGRGYNTYRPQPAATPAPAKTQATTQTTSYISPDPEKVKLLRSELRKKYPFVDLESEGIITIAAGSNTNYGAIDAHTGEFILQPIYSALGSFGNGLAPASLDGKKGYINRKGEFVLTLNDYAGNLKNFYDGFAVVQKTVNGKYGILNTKGELVKNFIYDYADGFTRGKCAIKIDGKSGYLTTSLKEVFPVEATIVQKTWYGIYTKLITEVASNKYQEYWNLEIKEFKQGGDYTQQLAITKREISGILESAKNKITPLLIAPEDEWFKTALINYINAMENSVNESYKFAGDYRWNRKPNISVVQSTMEKASKETKKLLEAATKLSDLYTNIY